MAVGRPRKPESVQIATGAWLKDPQRKRKDAAARAPLNPDRIPDNLHPLEQKLWLEMIDNAPLYVLKNCDAYVMEAAAKVTARIRYPKELEVTTTQWINLISTQRQLLSLMGMTPADRSRVTSEPDSESIENALDEFMNDPVLDS